MKHQQAVRDTQNKKVKKGVHLLIAKDGVFYTLQGEGRSAGHPTLFIRLHGSNICHGREELRHTWDESSSEYNLFSKIAIGKLIPYAQQHLVTPPRHKSICFTGGEAMVQQTSLIEFIKDNPDYMYEIETNGLIFPNGQLQKLISSRRVSLNINPILVEEYRLTKEMINSLSELGDVEFKLECEDISEIHKYIELFSLPIAKNQFYILPKGSSKTKYIQNRNRLFDQCIEYGLNLSPRMQLDINSEKQIYER